MPRLSTFALRIQSTSTPGEYRLVAEWTRADGLPAGREHTLELDPASLQAEADATAYGEALGRMVFTDGVRELFAQARADATDLRVMLAVEAKPLQALRWERLAAPFDDDRWQLLGQSQRTPFSMVLASTSDRRFPPFGRRDLRALVLVANPEPDNRYGVAPFDEAAAIDTALAGLGEIPSRVLGKDPRAAGPPTLDELCACLTNERYTLLHVVCHGAFSARTGETAVFLDGDDGKITAVAATVLIQRLRQLGAARGLPHLSFLAVCDSAKPEAESVLGGLGQRLVRELGMPAVVAMTERVSQATAFALAEQLYGRLRDHGMVDLALAEACAQVRQRGDVVVPALFSRLAGRPLFTDDLDRPLTASELAAAAGQLAGLFEERAPALLSRATALATAVAVDPDALTGAAAHEHQASLAELERLCEDVLELSFSALAHGRLPPPYGVRCPFPGLAPFTAEQRECFRGRDALVQALQQRLAERPLLAVVGGSGCGKSSLVAAGLLPRLQDATPALRCCRIEPGEHPLARLEQQLRELEGVPAWVLHVDQFEQCFTLCRDEPERTAFFERLLAIAAPGHLVILSLRADFIDQCAAHPGLHARLEASSSIPPLSADELRHAIEEQGKAAGLRYETGLVELLLEDVEGEPGAMPLLQHVLLRLYDQRSGRWLRVEAYDELGRMHAAITTLAEDVWSRLSEADKERLVSVMLELVEVHEVEGAEPQYLPRRVPLAHLHATSGSQAPFGDPTEIVRLVDRLASERLVIKRHQEPDGDVVELPHTALLRWERLRAWLAAAQGPLRLRQDLDAAMALWRANARSSAYLEHVHERGDRVRTLLREGTLRLDPRLAEYFDACEQEERRQLEEQQRQQQERLAAAERLAKLRGRAIVVVTVLLAVAVLTAIESFRQYRKAETALERQRGTTAELMADQPGRRAEAVAQVVRLSERAALHVDDLPLETRRAIFAATRGLHVARELRGHDPSLPIVDLAFSADGSRLATASRDATAKLWDARSGELLRTLAGHDRDVEQVVFVSPGHERVLTVDGHGHGKRWDEAGVAEDVTDAAEAVVRTSVSADGKRMATSDASGSVTVWIMAHDGAYARAAVIDGPGRPVSHLRLSATGSRVLVVDGGLADAYVLDVERRRAVELAGSSATLRAPTLAPDGAYVAIADDDGNVQLWDASEGEHLHTYAGTGDVEALAFDAATGTRLAVAIEQVVELWDLAHGEQLATLRGHRATVNDVAFSPDGLRLASVSWDKSLRQWDARTGAELAILEGHADRILHVEFSPDGEWIATAANDGAVRLWKADAGTHESLLPARYDLARPVIFAPDGAWAALAHSGGIRMWGQPVFDYELELVQVTAMAASRDGTRLVTASSTTDDQGHSTQVLSLWDVASERWIADLPSAGPPLHDQPVDVIAFSRDGERLATGDQAGTVRLWDARSYAPLAAMQAYAGPSRVLTLDFSPDHRRLLTGGAVMDGSDAGFVELWDLARTDAPLESQHHHAFVYVAGFSPRGNQAVVADANGGIRRWSLASSRSTELPAHLAAVRAAAFSSDGRRMASAGTDAMVRLWDADTGNELAVLGTHAREVVALRFVDGDRSLLSGSIDGAIVKWMVDPQARVTFACAAIEGAATLEADVAEICEQVLAGATAR